LADICDGDARIALNALELAVLTSPVGSDGKFHIDIQLIEECIQKKLQGMTNPVRNIMTISVLL